MAMKFFGNMGAVVAAAGKAKPGARVRLMGLRGGATLSDTDHHVT